MKYCAIISVIYLEYRLDYGKSLNGHKFHQYQQNEQPLPPQSIEHKKRPWHVVLEILVNAWDGYKNMAG